MHRFQYGPNDLPEALVPCRCPVTAALQLIRHETLETVGIYDEGYRMAFEDVDYCLRVFEAGLECIYEPSVRAFHREKFFRGRPSDTIQRLDSPLAASDEDRLGPEGPVPLGPGGALMEPTNLPRTLFMSARQQAPGWYRCALPAHRARLRLGLLRRRAA